METDSPSTSGQSRDVAAMGSAVEIEDETVVALRAALGRTIDSHEVEVFLRAVGVKDVNRDVTDRKKFPPSSEFVNYRPHGVSLCFENGKLDTVHCYSRGVDGYGEFAGALPSGIAMTSAALDVVRAAKQARRNPAAPRHLVDPTHQLDCCLLSPYHTPLLLRPSKTT